MEPQRKDDITTNRSANENEREASKIDIEQQPGERGIKALWRKGKALWGDFSNIKAETYASSIAYFTFLSLLPLIALSISLVTMVGIGEREVVEFFSSLAPDTFNGFTRTLVDDAYKSSGVAFSISTITLLWSASKGIRALHAGLNASYEVQETRSPLVVLAISVLAVLILGILLAATMYLVFGGAVLRAVSEVIPGIELHGDALNVLNAVAMAIIGVVTLCMCYTFLPAGERRFKAQLPGAALASLSCGVLTIGFHVYVDNFCNAEALYGSIATVALFLVWMYLISYILLAGAFLNRIRTRTKQS